MAYTSSTANLPTTKLHRRAAKLLRQFYEAGDTSYRSLEKELGLPLVTTHEEISNRYHYHLKLAGLSLKEHNLLYPIAEGDRQSNVPFGKVGMYLDNVRSAHNVGSIIRTIEALRLGTLYLSHSTPGPKNKKVKDAAMGAVIPVRENVSLEDLPRPLIALETARDAPSIKSYSFPDTFTLMVGNEEYGLSEEALLAADAIVQIPLVGSKNSINVANAVAIASFIISYGSCEKKTNSKGK